jgi:hypothetical protein
MPGTAARVYECYVRKCDAKAFTVDVQSRQGRNFPRVSYLLPYIRLSGTGINFVPELGAECLVIEGDGGLCVVVGFRMPFSVDQNERDDLPAGTIDIRVSDEKGTPARVCLIPGGTLLIQSKKSCRTLYSPADRSIVHVFSTWEMHGAAGHVLWRREVGEESASYEAEYRTKTNPDEPGFRMRITMSNEKPLSLILDRGESGDLIPPIDLQVGKNGQVDAKFGSLNVEVQGSLRVNGSDFKLNERALLPQGDPI